jgi:hypothetical protein
MALTQKESSTQIPMSLKCRREPSMEAIGANWDNLSFNTDQNLRESLQITILSIQQSPWRTKMEATFRWLWWTTDHKEDLLTFLISPQSNWCNTDDKLQKIIILMVKFWMKWINLNTAFKSMPFTTCRYLTLKRVLLYKDSSKFELINQNNICLPLIMNRNH